MIIGGNLSPHAGIVKTTVTCFFLTTRCSYSNLFRAFLCKSFVRYHIEENLRFIHATNEWVLEDIFQSYRFVTRLVKARQFLFQLFRELLATMRCYIDYIFEAKASNERGRWKFIFYKSQTRTS